MEEIPRRPKHLYRLARLGTAEPGEQDVLCRVHVFGPLRNGGIRLGDALPDAGGRGTVPGPVLGMGIVRGRDHSRNGGVQNEPLERKKGAGAPLYTPLHRIAPHSNPRLKHVLVLRTVVLVGERVRLWARQEEQGEDHPGKTDNDADEQKSTLGAYQQTTGQQKEEEKKREPDHERKLHT